MTYSKRFENSANEEQQPPARSHRSGGYDRDESDQHEGESFDPGNNLLKYIVKGLLGFAIASGIAALAFIIAFSIQADVVGPGDEGFSLYKNSRFRECAARNVNHINCTRYLERTRLLPPDKELDVTYKTIGLSGFPWSNKADTIYWCDVVGCLSHYQVVPAVPADGATTSSILFIWLGYIQACVFTVYAFLKQTDFDAHSPESCPENSSLMWLGATGSTLSMVWWWVDVLRMGGSPLVAYGMSPINWVSTWRAAQAFNCHPISCNLRDKPTTRKLLWGVLFAIASAQLGASTYIVYLSGYRFPRAPFYRFLEDEYTNTPGGTSSCTAAEIRNNPYLFRYRSLGNSFEHFPLDMTKTVCFVTLAGLTLPEMIAELWLAFKGKSLASRASYVMLCAHSRSIMLTVLVGMLAYQAIRSSIFFLRTANGEAPFVLDHTCSVIHVGLSGWRSFLDIQTDGHKALKVVRGLLNIRI